MNVMNLWLCKFPIFPVFRSISFLFFIFMFFPFHFSHRPLCLCSLIALKILIFFPFLMEWNSYDSSTNLFFNKIFNFPPSTRRRNKRGRKVFISGSFNTFSFVLLQNVISECSIAWAICAQNFSFLFIWVFFCAEFIEINKRFNENEWFASLPLTSSPGPFSSHIYHIMQK